MTTAQPKTVTIYRMPSFLSESQQGLDGYLAMSKQPVGGYWASTSSKAVGTGLSPNEINILLPLVLDIHHEDREFRQEVRKFYESLETPVDYKHGKTLNIGLEDDSKPLSKSNLPQDVMDYIRYRHALGNPEVAASRDEATGNRLKRFYIHDPNAVKENSNKLREKREEAMTLYLSISKEEVKVDNVLALFGEDPRTFNDLDDKLENLQKKTQSSDLKELQKFIDIAEDNQLEIKGFIQKLVKVGVLKIVGTRYVVAENGTVLADDLQGAVIELSDEEKNSELIVVLKSQLQEQLKKKVKAPAKKR